jgi:predicted transcriptional regulator
MTEFLQRLSQMIRDKRKELSISQERLAEMVGVTTSFVGQVERGE